MRYIIGLDLGTTNCALSYIDTWEPSFSPVTSIRLFAVPQSVAPGEIKALSMLPSFCYLIGKEERGDLFKMPWKGNQSFFVGELAKHIGARLPTRLVQSAKSWLCNSLANRSEKILPLDAADPTQRLSPVEATCAYLSHLKEAWNATIAKTKKQFALEEQEVIITVPASFDEVARNLTVEAAKKAGFEHITLLEEPQAAFYHWIAKHENEWQKHFHRGDRILVCDVGGGTTDFSLIEIHEEEGAKSFLRVAVGDHLLLGGDNIDNAIASFLEQKLRDLGFSSLQAFEWNQLRAEGRSLKEKIFSDHSEENYTVVIQKGGSSVVRDTLCCEVNKEEVIKLVMNGFFGLYSFDEATEHKRKKGIRLGSLPYEEEPSITKHMAHFLKRAFSQKNASIKSMGVDFVLFNGGTLKPLMFQEALLTSLKTWFSDKTPSLLPSSSLDLAVAMGAAYFGLVKRGKGVAIKGGIPRAYYLQVEVRDHSGIENALTILERGSKEGSSFEMTPVFSLRPNQPVSFKLFASNVRLDDKREELIPIDLSEMSELPPICTLLKFGKAQTEKNSPLLPVKLEVALTAIGTLELFLKSQISDHRWQLEFQLRSVDGGECPVINTPKPIENELFDESLVQNAQRVVSDLFDIDSLAKPSMIVEMLVEKIGSEKEMWHANLLRKLSEPLFKVASKRGISVEHQTRWWNLVGFFLRPGSGLPLDDFRIKELWKIILSECGQKPRFDVLNQMWICFRRVSSGLNRGQQSQIVSYFLGDFLDLKKERFKIKGKDEAALYPEKIRALSAFERLDIPFKIKLGRALLFRICHETAAPLDYFSLARLGARELAYASSGQVLPVDEVSSWISSLLSHTPSQKNKEANLFLLKQLARKTPLREINVNEETCAAILQKFQDDGLQLALTETTQLSQTEKEHFLGDQLPPGLIL